VTIIRARQPVATRITPNNGNKRYLKGNRLFDPSVLNPLPPFEFEFNSGGTLNYAENFPVDLDVNTGFSFGFELALRPATKPKKAKMRSFKDKFQALTNVS